MGENGDMATAVGEIIREQMESAGEYMETAADRGARANAELENSYLRLGDKMRETFGIGSVEELNSYIKQELVNTIEFTVDWINEAEKHINTILDLFDELKDISPFSNAIDDAIALLTPLSAIAVLLDKIRGEENKPTFGDAAGTGGVVGNIEPKPEHVYTEKRIDGQLIKATRDGFDVTDEVLKKIQNNDKRNTTRSTRKPTTQKSEEQENSEQIRKLANEFEKASETRRKAIQAEIKALQQRNAEIKYYQDIAMGKNVRPMEAKVDTSGLGQTNIATPTLALLQDQLSKPIDASAIVSPLQALEDELRRIMELQAAAWSPEQFAAYQKRIDEITGKIDEFKGIKQISKDWQAAGTAIQAVGSAMSQIEDPAAKVMGTIAQAIATIALTFASSLKGTVTPWDWIAAAAAGTATMISTISAIHSATGYAQGGIVDGRAGGFVGGTAYSGDNVGNVRLDSGELVLNKSQQNNLASALDGTPMNSLNLTAAVSGEQILLVANRTTRRQGKGELLTWR
jgi:hypothetical protein